VRRGEGGKSERKISEPKKRTKSSGKGGEYKGGGNFLSTKKGGKFSFSGKR